MKLNMTGTNLQTFKAHVGARCRFQEEKRFLLFFLLGIIRAVSTLARGLNMTEHNPSGPKDRHVKYCQVMYIYHWNSRPVKGTSNNQVNQATLHSALPSALLSAITGRSSLVARLDAPGPPSILKQALGSELEASTALLICTLELPNRRRSSRQHLRPLYAGCRIFFFFKYQL